MRRATAAVLVTAAVALSPAFAGTALAAGADPLDKLEGPLRDMARSESGDQVAVEIVGLASDRVRSDILRSGGTVGLDYMDLQDATIPVRALEHLAARTDVVRIRRAHRAVPSAVALESVGTTFAQSWQDAGYQGAGVKVAIIDGGFKDFQARQATGDLPRDLVTQDFCGGQLNPKVGGEDHGTAVAEIVYKMAPRAKLYLICFGTLASLGRAKDYVKANGIPIVNMSAGYFDDWRGDGMGPADTSDGIVADARAAGILWVNAAGNNGAAHWSGTFVPSTVSPNLAAFTASGDPYNRFTMPGNSLTCVFLKWDSWPVTSVDYDLVILDLTSPANPLVVASSTDLQSGSQDPTEEACYVNFSVARPVAVAIQRKPSTTAMNIRMDLYAYPGIFAFQYNVSGGSLIDPAASPSVLTVGAMCWSENAIASYSSQGPTLDGRVKPDIAGPASVSTATYGAYDTCANYKTGFAGTSASSPHVAGAAALVKGANPTFTAAQIQAFLEGRALDLGAAGKDNVFGSGKLQLGAVPGAPQSAGPPTVYLPNVTRMLGGADGWQTPFIVQNVGSAPTDLTMSFYAFADGSLVKTRTVTGLKAGTSVFHDPNSDTDLAPGGQYSVVVRSSGAPIVAVVNEHQNVTSPTRQEALSYDGLSGGSTAVFLPYIAKQAGGWLTTVIIQNLGTAPATVTAKFVTAGGAGVTVLRTIDAGRSQFIDPTVEAQLVAGTEYGATLTSTQPIAVVVNAHNDAASVPAPRGFSYNAIAATSIEDAWLPYIARHSDTIDRSSRVFVLNAGAAAASPQMLLRRHGDNTTAAVAILGPSLTPGSVWSFDATVAAGLTDGDWSADIRGGKFAVVGAALSPATAMGISASSAFAEKLYLPNVTRTLGGPNGWTTPLIVESTGAPSFTVKWFRFADGSLVFTRTYTDVIPSEAIRIDPRQIAQLTDDTQYAVVVESAAGGVAAAVLELNLGGGDAAMGYDGFGAPPALAYGTTGCEPQAAVAGTIFRCVFFGLPVGAQPTVTVTSPGGATTTTADETVSADGSWTLRQPTNVAGSWSASVTAGGVTKTAQFLANQPTFTVSLVSTTYGAVSVQTSAAGILCQPLILLPTGSATSGFFLAQKTSDATGTLSWTYTTPVAGAKAGQGTNLVRCFSGTEEHDVKGTFTIF